MLTELNMRKMIVFCAVLSLLTTQALSGKAKLSQFGPDGLLVPPQSMSVASAPGACTLDLIKNISWGAATAAYQIEGAYNEWGKGQSIWDVFVRESGKIKGGGTGDVAIDHAHRYEEDYKLMKDLGINMHRFSIAWTRIVPDGKAGSPINEEGVQFYHNLIDEMLANGITPVATMYHWDLPQALQDSYQGFLSEQLVADYVYYADTLWSIFGDKIKHWVTFNEPASICDLGYNNGRYAPGIKGGKTAMYRCGHNLLLAHAAAVQVYRQKYQPQQQGKVGLTTNMVWPEAMSSSPEDKRAAQNMLDRDFGWVADPLFFGGYPASSKLALRSDLPSFSPEQQAQLKGSTDFIGVNVYTARWVFANPDNPNGFKVTSRKDGVPIGETGGAEWLYVTPFALGNLLRYVGERYGKPETWVMEFGTGINGESTWTGDQALQDSFRTKFFSSYLNSACDSIRRDGLNVPMVFAWTMWDNFEWSEGYEVRYGLVHVNFTTLERRVKESGYWWSQNFFRHSKPPTV